MIRYVLNRNPQSTGEHEVHKDDGTCPTPPQYQNKIDLGYHSNCFSAVEKARALYSGAAIDGCKYCSPLCHTR